MSETAETEYERGRREGLTEIATELREYDRTVGRRPYWIFGPRTTITQPGRLISAEGIEKRAAAGKPHTPVSNFRIPADLKAKAQTKAASEGKTLTAVILDFLREYVR